MKKIKDPALFEKIREFLTEHLPIIKKGSPNTVAAYRYTLNLYLDFLQEVSAKELSDITSLDFTTKNIVAFMDWLISNRKNKAPTANLRLVHMRKFCRFLMGEDVLRLAELSAIQKIKGFPKECADEVHYLSVQEMKLVLSQSDTSKRLGIRDKFFMYLLYDSGCRVQEILDLRVRNFFIKNGAAQLHVIGKGNKFRATPISNELIEMFKEYCAHFHRNATQDDYLFYTIRNGIPVKMSSDNVQRFVEKYGAKARNQMSSIPHIHPHLFVTPELCICTWPGCRWRWLPNGLDTLKWKPP